jgi:NAD(P)-dependent dehydrogenase (short-subunit alcohol dehydrogenase family)
MQGGDPAEGSRWWFDRQHRVGRRTVRRPLAIVVPRVAKRACFLASDEAGYLTGQTISRDGGLSSKLGYVTFD